MRQELLEELKNSLLDLEKERSLDKTRAILADDEGEGAKAAVNAVAAGLEVVGERFQSGEWYLSELIYAGEIAKEVLALLGPLIEAGASETLGTLVVGTVAHDLHDLGKNIFVNFAKSAGFKVVDLGVDVSVETFVKAIKEHRPLALGMSCLLTSTEKELGKVIEAAKREGVRDQVKIIVGGACLSERVADALGADAFAPDAITGVGIVKGWAGKA